MKSVTALLKPEIQPSPLLNLSEGQVQHINLYLQNWQIALQWLIKLEFEDKFKIEGKRNLVNSLKPSGEYLRHIFLLCEACHARQSMVTDEPLPYANAGEWFAAIYKEKMGAGLGEIIDPYPVPDKAITKDKKRDYLRIVGDLASTAAKMQNPYPIEHYPHHSRLLEVAIALCEKAKGFKQSRYKPFVTAWKEHLKAKDGSDFKRHEVNEKGELHVQSGRHRGTKKLTAKKGFLKPSQDKASSDKSQTFSGGENSGLMGSDEITT